MNAIATKDIIQRAKELESYIIDIRRRLHQCPELQYELHETSGIVCEELEKLGVEFESGIAQTGVVAKIGSGSGKCVICLLYTSPSPRDQRGSRMPSSA